MTRYPASIKMRTICGMNLRMVFLPATGFTINSRCFSVMSSFPHFSCGRACKQAETGPCPYSRFPSRNGTHKTQRGLRSKQSPLRTKRIDSSIMLAKVCRAVTSSNSLMGCALLGRSNGADIPDTVQNTGKQNQTKANTNQRIRQSSGHSRE